MTVLVSVLVLAIVIAIALVIARVLVRVLVLCLRPGLWLRLRARVVMCVIVRVIGCVRV